MDQPTKKIIELTKELALKKFSNHEDFFKLIQKICSKKEIPLPRYSEIFAVYQKLKKQGKIKKNPFLEEIKKRPIRSLSGVAIVAVLTKPWPCPGQCFYCPLEKGVPKSYLSGEPAVERAKKLNFDPYLQAKKRIEILEKNNHPVDKIELIVIGGTWSYLPSKYQTWFIKRCFDGANFSSSKNLAEAQKKNENSKHRIIGITLETRPDYIDEDELRRMRKLGCTRVEIGVQSTDNKILKKNKRGHGVEETIEATRLLKDAGFKICYHLMPGLYGSSPKKDLLVFKKIFSQPEFQPDMIKIYPCVVTKGSQLYQAYKKGEYKPYSDKQLINLLIKIKKIIPPYVRINRLIRDIPSWQIQGGSKVSNLRQTIQEKAKEQGVFCQCIRCREIKTGKIKKQDLKLIKREYSASNGKEIFLSFENEKENKLIAFCRLRLPEKNNKFIFSVLKDSALIRELHTYGQLVEIDKKNKKASQHLGLGKKLIKEAEKIARKKGYHKMAIIAGIGVREYYRHLGYRLQNTYLIKLLK